MTSVSTTRIATTSLVSPKWASFKALSHAEVEGNLWLIGPSGMGTRDGTHTIQDVDAITYRLNMITGPPPGCPWQVTLRRAA
jgi:hypothetical protein